MTFYFVVPFYQYITFTNLVNINVHICLQDPTTTLAPSGIVGRNSPVQPREKRAFFAMLLILMLKFHIKRQGTKLQRTRHCQSLSLLGQDMKTSRKHDNLFKFVFFVAMI